MSAETEFARWLRAYGLRREDYARAVGMATNHIHMRARGERETPREVMALIRIAPGTIASWVARVRDIETCPLCCERPVAPPDENPTGVCVGGMEGDENELCAECRAKFREKFGAITPAHPE